MNYFKKYPFRPKSGTKSLVRRYWAKFAKTVLEHLKVLYLPSAKEHLHFLYYVFKEDILPFFILVRALFQCSKGSLYSSSAMVSGMSGLDFLRWPFIVPSESPFPSVSFSSSAPLKKRSIIVRVTRRGRGALLTAKHGVWGSSGFSIVRKLKTTQFILLYYFKLFSYPNGVHGWFLIITPRKFSSLRHKYHRNIDMWNKKVGGGIYFFLNFE